MQFTIYAASFLSLVGAAFAQTANFDAITSPTQGQTLTAGEPFQIVWDPTVDYDGKTVSILLLQGATPETLDIGPTVVSSIDSGLGKYTWTPDASQVGFDTYGFKLQLDSDTSIFQYSFPFKLAGGSGGGSSTTSPTTSSSAPTTTSSSSSSSSTSSSSSSSVSPTNSSSSAPTTTNTAPTSAPTTGSGGSASTTLTTATRPSASGGSAPTTTGTTPFVTAGAGKSFAAALGGVVAAAVFAL